MTSPRKLRANLLKIAEGGWFPILIGIAMFLVMSTWKHGRAIMFEHRRQELMPLEPFLDSLLENPPTRVHGTAVFLSADPQGVPHALLHNLAHNKILHERVIFLTILTEEVPWIAPGERMQVSDLGHGCYRITARLGFKDEVALLPLLDLCKPYGMEFELLETSYFVSRDVLVATPGMGMAVWREKLFATMMRNASNMAEFLKLPPNRVIELGTQIEI